LENQNKLKEYIDNYLENYFSSKAINFNSTQSKNFNDFNNNINKFFDTRNKNKGKNKNDALSKEKKAKKNGIHKVRNNIFNFEKRITKKLSEKNLNIFDKFKVKKSPKNGSTKKVASVRTNKSGNGQYSDRGPLSARESNSKYQINAEMIELLSNKIRKIKQSIKETSEKDSNSISSIFKKKKIPSVSRKNNVPASKKSDEFIEKKSQNSSKTRNKKNNNGLNSGGGTVSSNSNLGISTNLLNTIINNIYQTNLLSPFKKDIEYDKLMKTFQKFKRPMSSYNSNNNNNNNANNSKNAYNYNNGNNGNVNSKNPRKKESQKKKNQEKYNNLYDMNNLDNHFNIEVNIKDNNKGQSKKNLNKNDNLKSLNINFNNYTNNYNYNINPVNNNANNPNVNINNHNVNYNNSIINKNKCSSQKIIIMGKTNNKNEKNLKGIPINGFENLINKKYNTRNYNIPMSITDRLKQSNVYTTSIVNGTNSNRYKNTNRHHISGKIMFPKK